jgi:hypothetical protein
MSSVEAELLTELDIYDVFQDIVVKIERLVAILQLTSLGRVPGGMLDRLNQGFEEQDPVKLVDALSSFINQLSILNDKLINSSTIEVPESSYTVHSSLFSISSDNPPEPMPGLPNTILE